MTNILFISFVGLFIWQMVYMLKVRKHDKILFQFCDLRRDMIDYLLKNRNQLTQEDYEEFRIALDYVNHMIHHYNDLKINIFKIRKFFKVVSQLNSQAIEIERKELRLSNSEIKMFWIRMAKCLVNAFLAYSPIFRTRLTFQIIIFTLKLVTQERYKGLIQQLKKSQEFISQINNNTPPLHT